MVDSAGANVRPRDRSPRHLLQLPIPPRRFKAFPDWRRTSAPFALSRGLSLSKAPCRRVCREEPFDRLREGHFGKLRTGFDKLSPNGFGWRMLRFVANQEAL
jgi:hypothetical protein